MNRSKVVVLGGLLSATLLMPALPALADPKGKSQHEERENHGQHKGWEKHQAKKFDHDEHDRRFYRRPDPRQYRRDVRYDNRGHHNKPEIRQDFKDIHGTRKEISGDRVELRKDQAKLDAQRRELKSDLAKK